MKSSATLALTVVLLILAFTGWFMIGDVVTQPVTSSETSVPKPPQQAGGEARRETPKSVARQSRRDAPHPVRLPGTGAVNDPWNAVVDQVVDQVADAAAQGAQPDWRGIGILQSMIQSDPNVLEDVIEYCMSEQSTEALSVLRMVMAGRPESMEFAEQLSAEGEPAQRKLAYDLLQDFPPSEKTNGIARRALTSEDDPSALASAIAVLRPASRHEFDEGAVEAADLVATSGAEREAVVAELQELLRHDHPAVRSQSLLALVDWGADDHAVEVHVREALDDSEKVVREAALVALATTDRAEEFKAPLIRILASATAEEDSDVRVIAWQLLDTVSLNDEELALHKETYAWIVARSEVDGIAQ